VAADHDLDGQVDVWDGAEVGGRGVFIQAYEIPDADEDWPAFIGDQTRVCDGGGVAETAQLIRSYLAGSSVAGRQRLLDLQAQLDQALQVEEGKLQPKPQQPPGLPRRLPGRPGSGPVTPATFPGLPGNPPTDCPPRRFCA